jgi:hypothetical protein
MYKVTFPEPNISVCLLYFLSFHCDTNLFSFRSQNSSLWSNAQAKESRLFCTGQHFQPSLKFLCDTKRGSTPHFPLTKALVFTKRNLLGSEKFGTVGWTKGNVPFGRIASLSNTLKLCSDHFPTWHCQPGDLIRAQWWLDGARSPLSMLLQELDKLEIWPTWSL